MNPLPNHWHTERSALSQRLAREMLREIRTRGLRDGDRLPTVKEYAAHFQVAMPTVREALGRLEALGVVDVRHGSGSFVRGVSNRMVFASPDAAMVDMRTIRELLDARLIIEPTLARMAAERATASDLDEMFTYLESAKHAIDADDVALLDANLGFHLLVARIAGNEILRQFVQSVIELHTSEQEALITIFNNRHADYLEHAGIAEAIRAGDGERSSQLMDMHIRTIRDTLSIRWPDGENNPALDGHRGHGHDTGNTGRPPVPA